MSDPDLTALQARLRDELERDRLGGTVFLPPRFYQSDVVFRAEQADVLPRSWLFMGDQSELGTPGSYITGRCGSTPVIVVRDREGQLRAFRNVCPHRGSVLRTGIGECGSHLRCPYHGWVFDLRGQLCGIPLARRLTEEFDTSEYGLQPLRLATWGRFIFVNVSGDAPPLDECLEDGPTLLRGHQLDSAKLVGRSSSVVGLNWKAFSDINLDGYHIPIVHRRTIAGEFDLSASTMSAGRAWTSMAKYALREARASEIQPLETVESALHAASVTFVLHPTFILSALSDGSFFVTWCTPHTLSETSVHVMTYEAAPVDGRPAQVIPEAERQAALAQLAEVRNEDLRACVRTEEGMQAPGFQPGPVHDLELQAACLHEWLRAAYQTAANATADPRGQDRPGGLLSENAALAPLLGRS